MSTVIKKYIAKSPTIEAVKIPDDQSDWMPSVLAITLAEIFRWCNGFGVVRNGVVSIQFGAEGQEKDRRMIAEPGDWIVRLPVLNTDQGLFMKLSDEIFRDSYQEM